MFRGGCGGVRPRLARVVPRLGGGAALGARGDGKVLAEEMVGQPFHLGRIGAARVQRGSPASIDGAGIFTGQRDHVVGPAGRIFDVEVREGLPATAKTNDLDIVLAASVSHTLDDRVEACHVAAASEDTDAPFRHADPLCWCVVITTAAGAGFLPATDGIPCPAKKFPCPERAGTGKCNVGIAEQIDARKSRTAPKSRNFPVKFPAAGKL